VNRCSATAAQTDTEPQEGVRDRRRVPDAVRRAHVPGGIVPTAAAIDAERASRNLCAAIGGGSLVATDIEILAPLPPADGT